MLLRPALLLSDSYRWRAAPLYSPAVAHALDRAYTRIAQAVSPDEYLWACSDIAPWMGAAMAARQRVRVFLLFARAHEVDGAFKDALGYIDRALEVAGRGQAIDDFVDLLFYHAKLERARARYESAAEDMEACLDLLRRRVDGEDEALEPALRLELFAQLADYNFFLGHFAAASHLVVQAQRLAPRARGRLESSDPLGRGPGRHVTIPGQRPAARRVIGAEREHLAQVAQPPGDRRERRRVSASRR